VACWSPVLAADPVQTFIARADSLYRADDSQGLDAFVAGNASVAGAAVGSLVDAAVSAPDADVPVNQDQIEFAERISSIYQRHTGSNALLDLVATYRNFTVEQRALRRKAKALEAEARTAQQSGDLAAAAKSLEEANRLYQSIRDRRSEAIAWGSLGVVQFTMPDYAAAEKSYLRALEVRRAIEDRILEGRTLNALGSVNLQMAQFTEALDYYRHAVALRTATGDQAGLGSSLTYMGNTYYLLGRLGEARDAYALGLPILEAVGSPTQIYECLNGLANVYSDMGRLQSSNNMYVRAIESAHTAGNIQGEILCRNNLVLNLIAEYRFSEALDHLRVIETLLSHTNDAKSAYDFYRNSGDTYRGIGDLVAAREYYLAAASHADSLGVISQIENLINIGELYYRLGSYDRGLQYADKARGLAEGIQDRRPMSRVARLAGECERFQGRYDQALAHWQSALETDRLENIESLVLLDEISIANVHAVAGRDEKARSLYFAIEPRVEKSGQVDLALNLSLGIADTYEKTHPDSAVYYYERALDLLEGTRETLGTDAARSDFLSGMRRSYYEEIARYYAALVQTDPEGDWSARAFNTIERAKARGLLDLLEQSQGSKESATETALLDSLYRLDEASPDYEAQRRVLDDRYDAARDARLKSSLRGLSPADIAGIDDARKALSKDTVLLAYALGDSASLLWVIDRKGHELYLLAKRADLQNEALRFRDAMATPGKGDPTLRRSARRLYEALVKPAASRLADAKRLIIIPDGALFEVPFEVLLTQDTSDETPWHELPFLARSFTPIYAPSVSIYLTMTRLKKIEKHGVALLAVGDPDFSTLAPKAGRAPLDSLPYTRTEVLGISADLKDDQKGILLGRDASEGNFKQALRQSSPRLLHLATHGLVDPVEPSASSIVLGRDGESGEDGYLDTMEILSLPFDVDLVVLSACESARGRVSRSEGVVGLSRAFIASGAHGIVASLWAVSDESTSVLMDEFYKKMLGKKRPAGEALNEARFALMEDPDYAHPFYWSPFIVIGSERSPW
jgi:CHAT domain-containing protein/Tfp pilus assembly protein PilF